MNNTILEYIATERARGVRDEDIRGALLASGWKEEDIHAAFGGGDIAVTPMAPQVPKVAPGLSGAYLKQIFSGRIGRWHYFFAHMTVSLLCAILAFTFLASGLLSIKFLDDSFLYPAMFLFMFLFLLILLIASVFGLSLSVRRLHDLGHSGWWTLIGFIPWVSVVLAIYLLFFKGEQVPNHFGSVSTYARSRKGVWDALLGK